MTSPNAPSSSGTPVTVVAVHGNGGGSTRFSRVGKHLSSLEHASDSPAPSPTIEFVAIDLPGFNGVPPDPQLTSVADFADHLAVLLDQHSNGGERPVVLGHGIGGSIALDLASRRPDSMAALILHAPVAADLDTRLFPRVMSTRPVRELMRRLISARLPRPLFRKVFFPIGAPKTDTDVFFEGYRDCASFGTMFEIIHAEWFTALEPVTDLPAVLLWGEHDRVLKSGQTAGVAAKVPNASQVIEPGWDHFPMLEQPEDYARVIAKLANDLTSTETES